MRFTPEFIDKVREANDIVEIVGQYTELKGNGQRLMGRCPFPDHSDKSPSFSVSGDNQFFYCFGCKKGGNVFHFLELFNGLSFPEAVEFLARRASLPLPEKEDVRAASGSQYEKKDLFLKINKLAGVFFHQRLKAQESGSAVQKYLVKRGLSSEIVDKFRLGFALDEWQDLAAHLKARKVPLELAESLGLIKPKRNAKPEDSHFDLFRDRLMFPIFSAAGEVVGFGGRTLGDGTPKYLNSSDSPVFNKSRVLYGIHETGKFIRAQDSAVVVEGYMDAISLYAAGIKNVVAILGTAFTPDHAKILKRYTQNIVMLLDGDEAGLNGAERSLPILLEAGLMPKGFALPDKMDPDDFVKAHGAARLQDEIERAPELFSLLLGRRWLRDYHGSASEKVSIVDQAAGSLLRMKSRQLQDLYLLELSQQLDVEVGWLRKALSDHSQRQPRQPSGAATGPGLATVSAPAPTGQEESELPPDAPDEKELIILKGAPKDEAFCISLLLNHEALLAEWSTKEVELKSYLTHSGLQRILRLAIQEYRENPAGFAGLASSFASQVDQPGILMSALAFADANETPGAAGGIEKRLMADYVNAIKKRALKIQAKALVGQIKGQPSMEKLEEFMNIQRDRLAPPKLES